MQLLEHLGKRLLADAGVTTPRGAAARTPEGAAVVARDLAGPVVVKAQVPAGMRGKAGAIRFADDPEGAAAAAGDLLGAVVAGTTVEA
ncbi:MAG: ATP-grasp domain-containing protein, partial [Egibacteraceae bacterium]